MMLFKFKKPEIILDCFTSDHLAYTNAKINSGKAFFPEWFKKTPATAIIPEEKNQDPRLKTGTIKLCGGLKEYYRNAVIIPSWFTMMIDVLGDSENNISWQSVGTRGLEEVSHKREQYEKFAYKNQTNLKIQSPWFLKTKENINWVWSQPTWSQKDFYENMNLLPAIINYKYTHDTNISWMLYYTGQNKTINIDPLTPLVALHPMSDKKVIIKNHLVDDFEISKILEPERMFRIPTLKNDSNLLNKKKETYEKIETLNKQVKSYDHTKK